MESKEIPISNLLLDPNNYRLQEQSGFALFAKERFHLERVQKGTFERLKKENIKPLRDSIVANGFLQIERIVVAPHDEKGEFLIVEGNRRVAALMLIKQEYDSGIDIPAEVVGVLDAIPCLVIDENGQVDFFRETIMGIRHVGGIREWGGFQRAKLIADLKDIHDLESVLISQKLGLTVHEVNRRYRAFKALQQMQENDDFADYATGTMYPLFHEAVSLTVAKEWLEWNDNENKFKNEIELEKFYRLLVPVPQDDDAKDLDAKIKTFADVRQLRIILPNSEAKKELFRSDRTLVDALTIANRSLMTKQWKSEIGEAITALENIPGVQITAFEPDDIELLEKLIETAGSVLKINGQSKGS